MEAKQASGKTYTEIAKEVGLTNLYTAQLFQNQVRFPPFSPLYLTSAIFQCKFGVRARAGMKAEPVMGA